MALFGGKGGEGFNVYKYVVTLAGMTLNVVSFYLGNCLTLFFFASQSATPNASDWMFLGACKCSDEPCACARLVVQLRAKMSVLIDEVFFIVFFQYLHSSSIHLVCWTVDCQG